MLCLKVKVQNQEKCGSVKKEWRQERREAAEMRVSSGIYIATEGFNHRCK